MKTCIALLAAIAIAVPAFAQNTKVELAVGYANLNLPRSFEALALGVRTDRHSGFDLHQTVNLTPLFAMENYLGYYSLGRSSLAEKTSLIADVLGGKFSLRKYNRVVPYVSAGLGGWCLARCEGKNLEFPNTPVKSPHGFATKIGGGIDINLDRKLAWKTDISRMSFHYGAWRSGVNVSTGIILKLRP